MAPQKLKRVVIKEELVELTGDFKYALILNQFIYWTERRRDFDKFIEEEKKRAKTEGKELQINKTGGWVYKSSDDLADELMLGKSKTTLSRYVKELEDMGYLESRQNPDYKWDKTKQYRVNLIKINRDLLRLGYHLEGYKFDSMYKSIASCLEEKLKSDASNNENFSQNKIENEVEDYKDENSDSKNTDAGKNSNSGLENRERDENVGSSDVSNFNVRDFNMKHRDLKMKHRNNNMQHRESQTETAIPETTSKTTSEITNKNFEKEEQRAQERREGSKKQAEDNSDSCLKAAIENLRDKFKQVFDREPTDFELEKLVETEESLDLLLKAIEITGLNSRDRTLSYTIALLKDWQDKGLSCEREVEKMIEDHRKSRKNNMAGKRDNEGSDSRDFEKFDLDISQADGWNTGIEEMEEDEVNEEFEEEK